MSSHMMHEVTDLCDRIAMINHGTLLVHDTLENVLGSRNSRLMKVRPLEPANEEMVAKLCELDFVTTPVAYKIADLRPKYSNDVRAIFSKERGVTLDGDMIQSVLDIVSSY